MSIQNLLEENVFEIQAKTLRTKNFTTEIVNAGSLLVVDGAAIGGDVTIGQDLDVSSSVTTGDLFVTVDAVVGGSVAITDALECEDLEVRSSTTTSSISFFDSGTINYYNTFQGTTQISGSFIIAPGPNVTYHVTRIGNVCEISLSTVVVPNASLNGAGGVHIDIPVTDIIPTSNRFGVCAIENTTASIISRFVAVDETSDVRIQFYHDPSSLVFIKGGNDLVIEGLSFTYNIL